MHRPVMLLCALALRTVKAAPAPHPHYSPVSDPVYYSDPYTTPVAVDPYPVDPYPVDPYPADPYAYPTPTPYADPYYTVISDPYYSTPSDPYYYPPASDDPVDKPTYPPYTPNTKYYPSYPFCHIKIESYLIKVVYEGQSGVFAEYPYLIYTPSEQANGFSFGSIGKSLLKPNAHPAIFWVTSGDLDYNTASLAEYYKGYPHHSPPSYDEAYYIWIVEEIIVIVYITLDPPSYADYTKFGVNNYHHLTYNGLEKWALCPPSGSYGGYEYDTLNLYWIGGGEYPSGCIQDVHLYLVHYGFPYHKDTYYRKRKGIKSPVDTYPPSYYPPTEVGGVPAQPPYSPIYPIDDALPVPPTPYYYPPYTTPGSPIVGGVPASPSYYYPPTAAPVPAYPPYTTPVYPVVDDTPVTVYSPVYTSIVDGEPVDTGFYDELLTKA